MRRAIILFGILADLAVSSVGVAPAQTRSPDPLQDQPALESPTLARIRHDGLLRCGVIRVGPGVSETDERGVWRGFFPDYCRVLAAAVLGDADAVEFVEVTQTVRFKALNDGAFDVLMGNTTWTASRDTKLGLAFTQPIYYDGQGFMANRALGAARLADVHHATVCVNRNTTTIRNLEELIASRHLDLKVRGFDSGEMAYDSFFAHDCDILTTDRIALTTVRLSRSPDPDDYVLFPDMVSKEPLSPTLRNDDEDWFDVVQWSVFATLLAEEHGIRSDNLDSFLDSNDPEVRRLLGLDPGIGADLGLDEDWARRIVAQVGNYAEIFNRNLSPLGLDRGLNALWRDGGLLYAPPLR
ncbi:general L-amino acid transport system substrate-binding protein [Tistlia consotensis]|uniref:General L-amino acid transport system substrate-binding protein n=1 Tax=Tistlia consotensis USBA 355 TaxID=560819 RepID=A0A1Y6BLY2_9PROT|nr:amino acid ABC transporter substrate-binding protein [Tistlia consotensis]SMF18597.1 general L-amino acid transport system substrate-binding protein [Tistlia consotensis USBA 355]SNR39603.1 general L-amino acid transport system substrate-binding protein [Tistlia consotensis]